MLPGAILPDIRQRFLHTLQNHEHQRLQVILIYSLRIVSSRSIKDVEMMTGVEAARTRTVRGACAGGQRGEHYHPSGLAFWTSLAFPVTHGGNRADRARYRRSLQEMDSYVILLRVFLFGGRITFIVCSVRPCLSCHLSTIRSDSYSVRVFYYEVAISV